MIKITNSLGGKKEQFLPNKPQQVQLYVCGITPYDYAHIGHGRVYVVFDVLYRLLRFLDYNVTYCRNFTDIDDKIINRAQKELGDAQRYHEITDKFIAAFGEDIAKLGCLSPNYEPRVTDNIPEIIAFIKALVDNGFAYVVDGDVYFHINKFPDYGNLSKQKLEDLRAGARINVNDKKQDPLDFALWKGETEGPVWQSLWGPGRPGWHIECSVLAHKHLGEHIDIHGGGMDLMFPHHENEIAQSEACFGKPFSKYWMHNAFVLIQKEKMSKSLNNFYTLRDVFNEFEPRVIRFYYLNHHYRAPIDFAFEDIHSVAKAYNRLAKIFVNVPQAPLAAIKQSSIVNKMCAALCDDLNTPALLGVLFEHLDELQKNPAELSAVKGFITHVLGLELVPLPEKEVVITPAMEDLVQQRELARQNKDWARADELREQLRLLGYEVQDKKK